MNKALLEDRVDLEWLRDVHAVNIDGIACAILEGNEDAPERITLYTANRIDAVRYVLEADDNGNLHVV